MVILFNTETLMGMFLKLLNGDDCHFNLVEVAFFVSKKEEVYAIR